MRKPEPPPNFMDVFGRAESVKAFGNAVGDEKYQAVVRRIEARYHSWDRVQYIARAEELSAELLWTMVKMSRRSTYRTLPLRGERGESLRFNMPAELQEELMHVDQQLAGRLVASDERPLSAAHKERFIISALREEAIASSMLEGAATTRLNAKQMLASGRKPRTTGERMVANNYRAISFIRENRSSPLTPELLLRVQAMLTEGTLEDDAEVGRFRTNSDSVHVTDAYGVVMHTPPPAEELASRLKDLCNFANQESTGGGFVHPVIKASVIHFQLGFDHPFCDGNGRTARAMFYWAMLRAGYWLFEYIPISRLIYNGPSKYGRAYLYSETDEFDVTYFLTYKAKIISRARKELSDYIARKQIEMSEAKRVFESDPRLNHRQRELVVRMLRSPNLAESIQDHQNRHGIAYGTARSDLLDLEQWQYLTKMQVGNRFEFLTGPRLNADDIDKSAKTKLA